MTSSDTPFPVGQLVWAKIKGFPWWPGIVADESTIPPNVHAARPKQSKPENIRVLYFLGTHDFSWIALDQIRDYEDSEKSKFLKGCKSKSFAQALKEVGKVDEVVVPVYVEDVSTMNITTTNIPMASPVTTTTKSKRKANEDLIDNASAAKKKRKTKGAGDDGNDTPSSKSKSRSKGDKETAVPSGSTGNEVVSLDQAAKNLKAVRKADKLRKKQSEKLYELQQKEQSKTPFDRLLRLRMKLQRFLQQESWQTKDFEKASAYLKDTEDFEMTYDLLKTTKVGKVVKRISSLTFPPTLSPPDLSAAQSIQTRCVDVLKRWRACLPKENDDIGVGERAESMESGDSNNNTITNEMKNEEEEEDEPRREKRSPSPLRLEKPLSPNRVVVSVSPKREVSPGGSRKRSPSPQREMAVDN